MTPEITLDNIDHLAIGSAFLGTGGGGDPYLGLLLCREALDRYGPVPLISLDALGDDDNVFIASGKGAPTVMIEKLFCVEDQHRAVAALEARLGRTATAIMSVEMGGCNSMMPVAYAAMRRLPIVDADGMGRAFPMLHMTSFNINGIPVAPMTLADEHGSVVLFENVSPERGERLSRPVSTAMGASACVSSYPMTGTQARGAAVPQTLSAALSIGAAVAARGGGAPVERLLGALRAHPYYGRAYNAFEGKIVEIERRTSGGWAFGHCRIAALTGDNQAEIVFQNENLTLHVDGVLWCIVPDLLTIVDQETAHAIPTERLSYGQRVTVIACSAAPHLRTPEALAVVGPGAFNLEADFTPVEELMAPRAGRHCA